MTGTSRRRVDRLMAAGNAVLGDAAALRPHIGDEPEPEDVCASVVGIIDAFASALLLAERVEPPPTPEAALDRKLQDARVRRAVGDLPDEERIVVETLYWGEGRLEDAGAAVGEELGLLIASLEARSVGAGADAAELEAEIERFYKKAIDLSAASLPEHLRPKLREMVEEHLRDDPTLLAMTEDLRRGLRRG